MKPSDLAGAWACARCHAVIDVREGDCDRDYRRLAHAEGVMRTLDAISKLGEFVVRKEEF
jgi:hypothetical protein